MVNTVNVMKQPKGVLVHAGTNEINKCDFSLEKIEADIVNVIFKIKEVCPDSKIIISSLLPTK